MDGAKGYPPKTPAQRRINDFPEKFAKQGHTKDHKARGRPVPNIAPPLALDPAIQPSYTATDRMSDAQTNITSVLQEARVFKPSKEFSRQAHIPSLKHYQKRYRASVRSPEKFWGKQAKEELVWFKPFKKVLKWKEPFAQWFIGGQTNVSVNCLDKWLNTPTANKAALI